MKFQPHCASLLFCFSTPACYDITINNGAPGVGRVFLSNVFIFSLLSFLLSSHHLFFPHWPLSILNIYTFGFIFLLCGLLPSVLSTSASVSSSLLAFVCILSFLSSLLLGPLFSFLSLFPPPFSPSVIFKEVNTCNPASITGTLSRISLDDEDDPKLATHQEGINFSSLPGNIPPPNLLAQVPTLGTLNELNETPRKKEVNVEQQGQHQRSAPVYLCTESALSWARPSTAATDPASGVGGGEGDYMVLPRRTVSLKPKLIQENEKPLNISVEDPPFPPPPSPMTLHPAESEPFPADFATVDHVGVGLHRSYGPVKQVPSLASAHTLQVKQSRPSIRQIFTSGKAERTRTLPRNLGSANANVSAGSLEVSKVQPFSWHLGLNLSC